MHSQIILYELKDGYEILQKGYLHLKVSCASFHVQKNFSSHTMLKRARYNAYDYGK